MRSTRGSNLRGGNEGGADRPLSSLPPGPAAEGPEQLGEVVHAIVMRLRGGFPRIRVQVPAAPMSGGDDRSRRE